MKLVGCAVACAVVALVGASPANAAVTLDSLFLYTYAQANADEESAGQGARIGYNNVSSTYARGSAVQAYVTTSADFVDTTQATINFVGDITAQYSPTQGGWIQSSVVYSFDTSDASILNLIYEISKTNANSYYSKISLVNDDNGSVVFQEGYPSSGTANQSFSFSAGNYTLTIADDTYLPLGDSLTGGSSAINDSFSFKITSDLVSAVPEPASWALMILGFGLVGTMLRRKVDTNPTLKIA